MPARDAMRRKNGNGGRNFLLSLGFLCVVSLLFINFAGACLFDAEMKSAYEIGVGDEIRIEFSQPVFSISLDNVSISPFAGFFCHLSDDRRNLIIRPNGSFDFEKKYTVELKNIRALSGMEIGSKKFVFYTAEKDIPANLISVPGEFSEIKLSSDKYIPPESSRVKKEVDIPPHITEGKYIDVSISNQVMTLFEDGVKTNEFLVSTGKYGMPTPLGEYKIRKKETNHWSYQYKLWMPYSMNFSGPYYIHELPYWPNGYREGESHLGIRVSHGCIRLGIGPAKYVFDWAEIGTPLYIHQ